MMSTMTTTQTAKHFDVSTKTIRRWIRTGKLSAERIDGRWVVHVDARNRLHGQHDAHSKGLHEAAIGSDDGHVHHFDHGENQNAQSDSPNGSDVNQDVLHLTQENAHLREQLERADSEIQHLREQFPRRDGHIESLTQEIDHLTQVVAMSQKNIGALTEQLDDSRQMIEDMRQRRTVWQRVKAVFVAESV